MCQLSFFVQYIILLILLSYRSRVKERVADSLLFTYFFQLVILTDLYSSITEQFVLLPNLLYAELLSIFDCLTNFPSLPVRSGFDELFPVTTFLTVSQSHDTLISMFLYIT